MGKWRNFKDFICKAFIYSGAKATKRLKLFLILLPLFIFNFFVFQNCSAYRTEISSEGISLKSENNGSSYGGKPQGSFYRFIVDHTCESEPAAGEVILIQDSSALLTANSRLKCGASAETLNLADIDSSIYQNDLIGYREGIFQGASSKPTEIPANLVEIWCRDRSMEYGSEVILHYDRNKQIAVARYYFSTQNSDSSWRINEVQDFQVSRVVSSSQLRIDGGEMLNLTVYRDQPAENRVGEFKGTLKIKELQEKKELTVDCRLGGSVDPNVWPSKALTMLGDYPQNLGLAPRGDILIYSNGKPTDPRYLAIASTEMGVQKRVLPPQHSLVVTGGGVAQVAVSSDSQKLLFLANPLSSILQSILYLWDLGQSTTEMAVRLPLDSYYITSFSFASEGRRVIYEIDKKIPYAYSHRLKSYDFSDGSVRDLNPDNSSTNVKGIYSGIQISKSADRVLYLWSDHKHPDGEDALDLYSVNSDGTDLKKYSVNLPNSSWRIIPWDRGDMAPNQGQTVFIKTLNKLTREYQYYAVAIDGSFVRPLPVGWTWSFVDHQGGFALIHPILDLSIAQTDETKLMNLQSGQMISLPKFLVSNSQDGYYDGQGLGNETTNLPIQTSIFPEIDKRSRNHPSLFFSSSSTHLIGRKVVSGNAYSAVGILTTQGQEVDLCPGLVGYDMWIAPLSDQELVISTFNSSNQRLEVYTTNLSGECRLRNQTLTTNVNAEILREMKVSPDKKSILVRIIRKYIDREVGTAILYIPLNGRLSYQVHTPITSYGSASSAYFSGDSLSIVYMANQYDFGIPQVYQWKVPQEALDPLVR